jgi:hypothetical protein
MDQGKIKNWILLVLLLLDLALGALLLAGAAERANYRRLGEESLFAVLRQRGLTPGEALELPDTSPKSWHLERSLQTEETLAARLLGTATARDQGGNIYTYTGENGTASFRGTGEFEIDFTRPLDPGRNAGDLVLRTLERLGLDAREEDLSVQTAEEGQVYTALCRWQEAVVWNCRVRFTFTEAGLVRISGQRLFDTAGEETDTAYSAYTAVLCFLDSEFAGQAGTLEAILPGYTMSVPMSGSCTLQPVWVLETDAGRFQVNAVTGRTEQLAE